MKADISVVGGNTVTPILPFRTDDRTTSTQAATIKPGEPIKQAGNFVIPLADGDPEVGTDAFIGIAESESDETATVDGMLTASVAVPFVTKMQARMTTPANCDTDDELEGILMDAVCIDLAAGVFTIDENEGDDPNVHAFVIVDGDIRKGTLDFYVKPLNTLFGNAL